GANYSKGHATQPDHFLLGPQLQEPVDGGLDEVERVGAAVHLGQDVGDAARLEHLADARAGLHAGAGAGGDHDDPAGPVLADDPVRDGVAAERDLPRPLDVPLALLDRLLDGRGHLVGLAVAVGDLPPPVADDDQGVEAEPPAALDHAGAPPDL